MKIAAAVPIVVVFSVVAAASARAAPQDSLRVVGEFTTRFPCCAPRVTNIRRAAMILDGRWIRPRGSFSLNAALGERTRARGFVAAPMISGGRLVDGVCG